MLYFCTFFFIILFFFFIKMLYFCTLILYLIKKNLHCRKLLSEIISFTSKPHISAVNLMACMSSLVTLARARPAFLSQVFETLELLHCEYQWIKANLFYPNLPEKPNIALIFFVQVN